MPSSIESSSSAAAARALNSQSTISFDKEERADRVLSREFGSSPRFFEMRTLPSVKAVIQTSPDNLSVADVTLAVRTFFRDKTKLSVEEVRALKVRVDYLPTKCEERLNFSTFFEMHHSSPDNDSGLELTEMGSRSE